MGVRLRGTHPPAGRQARGRMHVGLGHPQAPPRGQAQKAGLPRVTPFFPGLSHSARGHLEVPRDLYDNTVSRLGLRSAPSCPYAATPPPDLPMHLHSCAASGCNMPCMFFIWRMTWSRREKPFPHSSHLNRFTLLWVALCLVKFEESLKHLSQTGHLCRLSSLCALRVWTAVGVPCQQTAAFRSTTGREGRERLELTQAVFGLELLAARLDGALKRSFIAVRDEVCHQCLLGCTHLAAHLAIVLLAYCLVSSKHVSQHASDSRGPVWVSI